MVAGVDGKRGRAVDNRGPGPAPLLPASHPSCTRKSPRGAFLTPMLPIKSEWTGQGKQGWCPAAFGGEEHAGSFWGKG